MSREPELDDDLAAFVRFHGANEVIDALIEVAAELNNNTEQAVEQVHRVFLRRSVMALAPEDGAA